MTGIGCILSALSLSKSCEANAQSSSSIHPFLVSRKRPRRILHGQLSHMIFILCSPFLQPVPSFIFSDSDVTQQVNLDIDSRYRTVGRTKLVVPFGNESSCRTGTDTGRLVGLSPSSWLPELAFVQARLAYN